MNEPIKIKATLPAWLFYFYSVDELMDAIKSSDPVVDPVSMLSFTKSDRSKGENPCPLIGEAVITVTLFSRDKLVAGQLESLQAALQNERAESMQRQNAIKDRISKLQALTNEATHV